MEGEAVYGEIVGREKPLPITKNPHTLKNDTVFIFRRYLVPSDGWVVFSCNRKELVLAHKGEPAGIRATILKNNSKDYLRGYELFSLGDHLHRWNSPNRGFESFYYDDLDTLYKHHLRDML